MKRKMNMFGKSTGVRMIYDRIILFEEYEAKNAPYERYWYAIGINTKDLKKRVEEVVS